MSVYIKQISSTRRIMYFPVKYSGAPPISPLWQAHVFDSSGTGSLTAGVWIWMGCYCTHFEDTTEDVTVFNNSKNGTGDFAWNEQGTGWNASASVRGADDGETSGVTSHQYAYTETLNDYAELTFTVSNDWAGASLDTQWYATTISCGTITATKDGQAFAINGRGSDYGASNVHRRIPRWNSSDRIQSDNVSDNFTAEILRNLQPGSYTLRITMNGDSTRMAVGRARLRKRTSAYLDPTSSTVREYFPEYDSVLGPYMTDDGATSYIHAMQDVSTWVGGPGHGNETQASAIWQTKIGAGSWILMESLSDGNIIGPFDNARLTTSGQFKVGAAAALADLDVFYTASVSGMRVQSTVDFLKSTTMGIGYISMMIANSVSIPYEGVNPYDFSDVEYPDIKTFAANVASSQVGDETTRRIFQYNNLPSKDERNVGRRFVLDANLNQADFANTTNKILYQASTDKSYYTVGDSVATTSADTWVFDWNIFLEEADPSATGNGSAGNNVNTFNGFSGSRGINLDSF